MSQVSSEGSRGESENRSKQSSSVAARGAVQSPSVSQQGSTSQVVQNAASGNAVDRNQRKLSDSSSASRESDPVRPQKTNERVEGSRKTTQKQTVSDGARGGPVPAAPITGGFNTTTSNGYSVGGGAFNVGGGAYNVGGGAYNVGGGAYNVGGGAYNVGGGAYNVGGGAYNVGGGAYNVGGGAYNVGGGAYNVGGGAYSTGFSAGSFSTGADAYSLNAGTPVATTGERRKGRFRQEHVRLPDQAQGQVRQVRQRLPTPEPDTIERTLIQRAPAEIVEEITEIPTTPPPILKERTVVEPAGPPQVTRRTIRVPPRSGGVQQPAAGAQFGFGGSAPAQQFAASYQPAPAANFSAGLAVGGGYQQPSVPNFGVAQPRVVPPPGCQPAFCFYM